MKHLLKELERYEIGLRPLTEDDFWKICEQENILVLWSGQKFSFYFTVLGRHFIVLPRRRQGIRLLFAMYHELGHFWCHVGKEPMAAFDGACTSHHDKDEIEADAVALLALMPQGHEWLKDETRFSSRLYRERERLLFVYGV